MNLASTGMVPVCVGEVKPAATEGGRTAEPWCSRDARIHRGEARRGPEGAPLHVNVQVSVVERRAVTENRLACRTTRIPSPSNWRMRRVKQVVAVATFTRLP